MNHRCSRIGCSIDIPEIMISIDDGQNQMTLCPNHVIEFSLCREQKKEFQVTLESNKPPHVVPPCELCNNTEAFVYTTRGSEDTELQLHLCNEHLDDLIMLDLKPDDFKKLHAAHGTFFEIHCDIYDPNSGVSIQPRR